MLLARPLSIREPSILFNDSGMLRSLAIAVAVCTFAGPAAAQIAPAAKAKAKPPAAAPAKKATQGATEAPQPATSAKAAEQGTAGAAPATAPAPAPEPVKPSLDQEEFRRQVMEEVRRELQKTRDEVKQETAWVEQDSQARVQDSEAVEQLKQRVNLFQPHGYIRLRGEFFNNMRLGRGADPSGHQLFPGPFIGEGAVSASSRPSR